MAHKTINRIKTTTELADATIKQRLQEVEAEYRAAKAVADRLEKERKVYLDEAVERGLDCVTPGSVTYTAKGTLLELTQVLGPTYPATLRIGEAVAKALPESLYTWSQSWKVKMD